jgi:carboxypeptidase Q
MTLRPSLLLSFFCIAATASAQTTDMTAKIRAEGLAHSQAGSIFDHLTLDIGPRLTNSPAFNTAVAFVTSQLKGFGLDNVHDEPWKFGRGWTLNKLTVEMVEPRYAPLIGYAEGWSPATPGDIVAAPLYLGNKSAAEIDGLKASMKGAIVMTQPIQKVYVTEDRPQPTAPGITGPDVLSPPALFNAGRDAQALNTLVRTAGAGVILRPNVLKDGTVYVTGRDNGPSSVPSIIMDAEHYNMIARMIEHGQAVKLRINVQATFQEADTNANNIIAEITGTDPALKNQVVMLGAHVDSWHTGQGATDNADGTAVMMEAMRILANIGVKPRRTIRLGIWGGEEQGLLGSKEWVTRHLAGDANKDARENFSLYLNMDNGTNKVFGFGMENNEGAKPLFDKWLADLKDMGVRKNVNTHITSTDHLSFIAAGVPGFNPFQDYEGYDVRTHHTNMDMTDHVNPEDLKQAAIVMATFAWNAAQLDERLPRK